MSPRRDLPPPPANALAETRVDPKGAPRAAWEATDAPFAHERLRPDELLGQGGLGQVWCSTEAGLRRQVAVKSLLRPDPESHSRFVFEARIAARLEHPGIVPVYELTHDAAGRPLMVMKRVRGRSLAEVIDALAEGRAHELARFDPALAGDPSAQRARLIFVFDRACDAVAAAHARGVLHRDLKPANIMVGAFGEVLVLDWGLARELGAPDVARSPAPDVDETGRVRTRAGELVGTPMYMSPEQVEGDHERLTAASDVYSLGATLFELLTLVSPFEAEITTSELLRRVSRGETRSLSGSRAPWLLPAELRALIARAMAIDPAARYADVPALQADLAAYRSLRPMVAYRDGLAGRAMKAIRRRPARAAAWTLAALLLATLTAGAALVGVRAERGRAALAAVEVDRAQAEAARARAVAEAAEAATSRTAALDALVDEGLRARDQSVREFDQYFAQERARGKGDVELVRSMPMAKARRLAAALDRLCDAHDQFGSRVEISVDDCLLAYFVKRYALGDYAGALAHASRAIAVASDPAYAHYQRGALLMEDLACYAEAEADFSVAVERYPGRSHYWSGRALARAHQGLWDGAASDAQRAIELEPGLVQPHYTLALVATGRGTDADATAAYDRALEVARDGTARAMLLAARSRHHEGAGRAELALADARAATQADPRETDPWLRLAQLLASAGQNAEAADAWVRLGVARLMGPPGGRDPALAAAEHARALDPTAIGPDLVTADAHRLARRWGEAVQAYDRALDKEPARLDARRFRAVSRLEAGDAAGAIADAEAVLAAAPGDPLARLVRGRALLPTDAARAVLDLRASAAHLPDMLVAWTALAQGELDIGEPSAAAEAIARALAIDDAEWRPWQVAARIAVARGDPPGARRAYREALHRAPDEERPALALSHDSLSR